MLFIYFSFILTKYVNKRMLEINVVTVHIIIRKPTFYIMAQKGKFKLVTHILWILTSDSFIKRFYRRLSKVRVPLYLALVFWVVSCIIVWSLTLYSIKVITGEVGVVGIGVGVYWDGNCDNPVNSLSWGKIVVNPLLLEVSKYLTVYVRNEGSIPAIIHLNVTEWSPFGIERYISLSWSCDGRVLGVNEAINVTLILSIDSEIWFEPSRIQDFSFNIIISASSP